MTGTAPAARGAGRKNGGVREAREPGGEAESGMGGGMNEGGPGPVLRVVLAVDRRLTHPWGLMALCAVLFTVLVLGGWPLGPVVAGSVMAAVFAVGAVGRRYERRADTGGGEGVRPAADALGDR